MIAAGIEGIAVASALAFVLGWAIAPLVHWIPEWLARTWVAGAREIVADPDLGQAPIGRRERIAAALLAAGLAALVIGLLGAGARAIAVGGAACVLFVASWIDLRTKLLPDVLTLPLMWVGLLLATLAPWVLGVSSEWAVLGAAAGYGLLWTVGTVGTLVLRRPAMGGGDAKLLGAAGAWMGLGPLPDVLVVAAVCGLGTALIMALVSRLRAGRAAPGDAPQGGVQVPFGPSIAFAAMLALLDLI